MRNRRLILTVVPFAICMCLTPALASQEADRIIARINQNFTFIDFQIISRKQNLSPIFLDSYESTKKLSADLQKEAENTTGVDNQRIIKSLKNVEAVTNVWVSFFRTAANTDSGVRKVKFDTQINGKSTCGWKVGWISLGRDGLYEPEYFIPYSTALPPDNPKELPIGEYVIYFYDPNRPEPKYRLENITLTRDSDEIEIIPIEVPYKTRIRVKRCPRK
jgi:hypothetical protein